MRIRVEGIAVFSVTSPDALNFFVFKKCIWRAVQSCPPRVVTNFSAPSRYHASTLDARPGLFLSQTTQAWRPFPIESNGLSEQPRKNSSEDNSPKRVARVELSEKNPIIWAGHLMATARKGTPRIQRSTVRYKKPRPNARATRRR